MCSINGQKVVHVKRHRPIIAYRICDADGWDTLRPQHWDGGERNNTWRNSIAQARMEVNDPLYPDLHNKAGLHARRSLSGARRQWERVGDVVVKVALWGQVVVGTGGYRAEYAKVRGIIPIGKECSREQLAALRRRYRVRGFSA